ncbi:MAG TPA: YozQ family protein [Candidatus Angelobacter sp.]|nr:YozQ family protein [Candidatus Angelobacter sp.]
MPENQKPMTKQYDPSDYKKTSIESKGLATTHEQVSDTYTEGTIDGVMEDVNGKDIPLESERS